MTSIISTTRAVDTHLLSLRAENTKSFLERIKPSLSPEGRKTINQAMGQSDEKLALVGILLYAVRPEMEENESLFEVEEEILKRIDDDEFVAHMEEMDEQKKLLEAMSQGVLSGMDMARSSLGAIASNTILEMDTSLKELKDGVSLFHEERKRAIVDTTDRIRSLRREEEHEMTRLQERFEKAQGVGQALVSLQGRLHNALDKLDDLKWKV